ncbi:MAG: MBL fold metallo-hydrolase [Candidatus Heimdallarchaeota archaeon]
MASRINALLGIIFPIIIIISVIATLTAEPGSANEKEIIYAEKFNFGGVEIRYMLVEGFKLKSENLVVYIDPYGLTNYDSPFLEPADYIIITHGHSPHYSLADIALISGEETVVIDFMSVRTWDTKEFESVSFEFVPMYNINKYRDNGQLYHPPGSGKGVIVEFGSTRIYHAGDTDRIPEMKDIVTDIALLPVSGLAWMTPEEAAGAVEDLNNASDLQYAIPMHYTGTQGTLNDARRFSELANCDVVILDSIWGWETAIESSTNSKPNSEISGWGLPILLVTMLVIIARSRTRRIS